MRHRFAPWIFLLTLLQIGVAIAGEESPPKLFLEVEVTPDELYVQQQAIYRMRFFQSVDVRDLAIIGPKASLAEFRSTGPDNTYQEVREGRRYRVHERSYLVFPFASGRVELLDARVEGERLVNGGRESIRIAASPKVLQVQPAPPLSAANLWLPAHSLSLSEQWSVDPESAKSQVGEIIRRTIRLEAQGLLARQLPEINFNIPNARVHAEPPRLENRLEGDINIALREQVFIIRATRVGKATVPGLSLEWWNTREGRFEFASLPAKALYFDPAAAPLEAEPIPPPERSEATAETLEQTAVPTGKATWLTSFIALPLVVITLLLFVTRRRLSVEWQLYRAQKSGSAGVVRQALLEWFQVVWPMDHPPGLMQVANQLGEGAARTALIELERACFGPVQNRQDPQSIKELLKLIRSAVKHRLSSHHS